MNIKVCGACGKIKLDQLDFGLRWDKNSRCYYYRSWCHQCKDILDLKYRQSNKDQINNKSKIYYYKNLDHNQQRSRNYYKNNKQHHNEVATRWNNDNATYRRLCSKRHYALNKSYYIEKCKSRLAKKMMLYPKMSKEEKLRIKKLYKIKVWLGPNFHVDHIIPLSKDGLHHPDNLQIITKEDNWAKHDKLNYELQYGFCIKI